MKKTFDNIETVVADVRRGKNVIVVTTPTGKRGDLIMAAQSVTPRRSISWRNSGAPHLRAAAAERSPAGIDRMCSKIARASARIFT